MVIDARLHEENDAKKMLAKLEELDVDSTEFGNLLARLERGVIVHAMAEEREEFALLATSLDQAQLVSMRRAAEFAEKVAPTRPHPGVESATGTCSRGRSPRCSTAHATRSPANPEGLPAQDLQMRSHREWMRLEVQGADVAE